MGKENAHYIHTYTHTKLALKGKEIITYIVIVAYLVLWMELGNILLSEIMQ